MTKWSWTLQKKEDINMAHQNLWICKRVKLGYHLNHLKERRHKILLGHWFHAIFSYKQKFKLNWEKSLGFSTMKRVAPSFYQKGQVHGLKLWAPCESMELEGSHIIMLPLPFIVDNLGWIFWLLCRVHWLGNLFF
jgi:hypothetical protein